jgi:hypothetical protein
MSDEKITAAVEELAEEPQTPELVLTATTLSISC